MKTWLICICAAAIGAAAYLVEERRAAHSDAPLISELRLLEEGARARVLPDMDSVKETAERKQLFFSYLAPIVQTANAALELERIHLTRLKLALQEQIDTGVSADVDQTVSIGAEDLLLLNTTGRRYLGTNFNELGSSAPAADLSELLASLQERLQPVPASLALAQAALESAWGTSRFAREGNNLFGQWCFTPGCGLVPLARGSDADHEVTKFDSVYDSVVAYLLNLNTHSAYAELRALRSQLIESDYADGNVATGVQLAAGLESYSAIGADYVTEIRRLIKRNQLQQFSLTQPLPLANEASLEGAEEQLQKTMGALDAQLKAVPAG